MEYDFVFIGDDGQGDLLAGQRIEKASTESDDEESAENSAEALSGDAQVHEQMDLEGAPVAASCGRMLGVLIHEVRAQGDAMPLVCERATPRAPGECYRQWQNKMKQRRLFCNSTYVGAAVDLHSHDPLLVSADHVATIADDAMLEFENIMLMHPERKGSWDPAAKALKADLARANDVLSNAGLPCLRRLRNEEECCNQDFADVWGSRGETMAESLATLMRQPTRKITDRLSRAWPPPP
jgi:hypothetical protein